MEQGLQLGMLIRTPSKRIFLICVCGRHRVGWKETKHWSDVEITQQRSRFPRTNIFPWSCILGIHSKTKWNKQRHRGQRLSHVWIENFRGANWKASVLWEFSYFFLVLRYRRSCEEIRGAILWGIKQDDSTSPQISTPCIDDHHFKEEETKSFGELSQVCSQIVLKCLYLARIGRLDTLWSVKKLLRSITKWTKACDKRLNRLLSYIHNTCEYKQYCYVCNTATQCRLGLFQDSDWSWGLEITSWMCQKQTSVSHSSTESEIISLDAGLTDGLPALELWDLIFLL